MYEVHITNPQIPRARGIFRYETLKEAMFLIETTHRVNREYERIQGQDYEVELIENGDKQ